MCELAFMCSEISSVHGCTDVGNTTTNCLTTGGQQITVRGVFFLQPVSGANWIVVRVCSFRSLHSVTMNGNPCYPLDWISNNEVICTSPPGTVSLQRSYSAATEALVFLQGLSQQVSVISQSQFSAPVKYLRCDAV